MILVIRTPYIQTAEQMAAVGTLAGEILFSGPGGGKAISQIENFATPQAVYRIAFDFDDSYFDEMVLNGFIDVLKAAFPADAVVVTIDREE